jgi:hypothetical protein
MANHSIFPTRQDDGIVVEREWEMIEERKWKMRRDAGEDREARRRRDRKLRRLADPIRHEPLVELVVFVDVEAADVLLL